MKRIAFISLFTAALTGLTGCKKGSDIVEIRAKGSDTMIQLSTAWAEAYRKVKSNVQINAIGGGSGTGLAALQNNTTDICNSSRKIKPEEAENVKKATGKDVTEHIVCFDALAVYVHPSNPLEQISVEELREIWAENGAIENWEQVGGTPGKITLVGRQNNSGTYDYFREHICGKNAEKKQREFRQGVSELVGSAEVVETISKTPTAMGYSGMGYRTDKVKVLKISNKKGEPGVAIGEEVARNKSYPIARELFIYTAGEPSGEVKDFLNWVKGPDGQAIVSREQFVSLTK